MLKTIDKHKNWTGIKYCVRHQDPGGHGGKGVLEPGESQLL